LSADTRLTNAASMLSDRFDRHLEGAELPKLRRTRVRTLQLNITKRCNLACHHCHVESGPKRTESMDRRTAERVIELLAKNPDVDTLDLTGGAPELNPYFRYVVREARALGRRVIDRCNLTIFYEPGQEDTAEFLAEQGVNVVASLPCYSRENVEKQRGRGVFDGSITALQRLCGLGYAKPGTGLKLDLVYNPVGAFLPPAQQTLEAEYRNELRELFGIEFNSLFTITNMPIKRFAHDLVRDGELENYMSLLVAHFNAETVPELMCRELLSVAHDGRLYDCDFNQMLEIELGARDGGLTVWDIEDFSEFDAALVATGAHCFGCTAGAGSSCGGAVL
jgi:radical SAM/Cys-rich protein